jgi:hypothetical protein
VITIGGALLGWIGGGMIVTDPALPADLLAGIPQGKLIASAAGAALVVALGKLIALRATKQAPADLANPAAKETQS